MATVEMAAGYPEPPTGFRGRMRVSLLSVINALSPLTACEINCLSNQKGQPAYCVSALLLWLRSCTEAGEHAIACKCARTRLEDWLDEDIPEAEQITRRAGCGMSGTSGSYVLFGRIKTLMGRDLRGHDIKDEIEQRSCVSVTHAMGPELSRDAWYRALHYELHQVVGEAMSRTSPGEQSPAQWGNTRAIWMPGGTSSEKTGNWHALAEQCDLDPKILINSKKMVWATQPLDLGQLLKQTPAINARAATKNEPGLKRRPLHAANDTSYLIASYASAGAEKTHSIRGSVMRQRPNDVLEAMLALKQASEDKLVLCVDYADYNKTHTILTRCLLSAISSRALLAAGKQQMAQAADWMCRAHQNHYINGVRIAQGLSSGERDTAKDNTTLHLAYANMAWKAACGGRQIDTDCFFRCCGDDELLVGCTWLQAIAYIDELQAQGHRLQVRKLMLSSDHGEFLQYNMFSRGGLPKQPLAPALINFVSGSWYKSSSYIKEQIASQVASSAAGICRRGVDLGVARKLAISCCNWLVGEAADWRAQLAATDLFGNHAVDPPAKSEPVAPTTGMKESLAAQDFCNYMRGRYPALVSRYGEPHIKAAAAASAFAQILSEATRKRDKQLVTTHSIDQVPIVEPDVRDELQLATKCINSPSGSREDYRDMVAFTAGLPPSLLRTDHDMMQAYSAMPCGAQTRVCWQPRPILKLEWYEKLYLPGALVNNVC